MNQQRPVPAPMIDTASDSERVAPDGARQSVFVIGEIGINHNGDVDLARKLIDVAAEAGADAVKFQKRTVEAVYSPEVLDAPRESPWGETQRAQKDGLEFGQAEYDAIDAHCRAVGMQWFASAWDTESLDFLECYAPQHNKVASAMLTHLPFLEHVAATGRHSFVSTGMSEMEDVERAVAIFRDAGCPFTLMHSVSTYPAQETDLNLRCIETLRERFGATVGYSGHEPSLWPSVAAAMLGAVAIERHITLDKTIYGSDQSASLEPEDFKALVTALRDLPAALGDGKKRMLDAEKPVAEKLRYWE